MNDGRFAHTISIGQFYIFPVFIQRDENDERDRWQNGTLDETERNLAEASWASFAHKESITHTIYITLINHDMCAPFGRVMRISR